MSYRTPSDRNNVECSTWGVQDQRGPRASFGRAWWGPAPKRPASTPHLKPQDRSTGHTAWLQCPNFLGFLMVAFLPKRPAALGCLATLDAWPRSVRPMYSA